MLEPGYARLRLVGTGLGVVLQRHKNRRRRSAARSLAGRGGVIHLPRKKVSSETSDSERVFQKFSSHTPSISGYRRGKASLQTVWLGQESLKSDQPLKTMGVVRKLSSCDSRAVLPTTSIAPRIPSTKWNLIRVASDDHQDNDSDLSGASLTCVGSH